MMLFLENEQTFFLFSCFPYLSPARIAFPKMALLLGQLSEQAPPFLPKP